MKLLNNPFSIETSALPQELIVDRIDVVNRLFESVSSRKENVLVFGEHGIGKTCLLKKLREKLAFVHGKRLLLIELDMLALSGSTSEFLAATIQRLLEETWVTVFGLKYSDLIGGGLEGKRKLGEQMFRQLGTFIDLFKLIRPEGVQHNIEKTSQVGGSVGISASRAEKFATNYSRGTLQPSEFIQLAGEIISILHSRGVKQIIVFGDEANHVKPELELNLFRSNFEMFSRQNVQFVFAANRRALEAFPKLQEVFPVLVDLREFESISHLEDLLTQYCHRLICDPPGVCFSADATEKLWRVTQGHPREIQRICQRSVEVAAQRSANEITVEMIFEACLELYDVTKHVRCSLI